MVGLERSVLPLVGEQDFGLDSTRGDPRVRRRLRRSPRRSRTSPPAHLADRVGRKRLLVLGWLVALPVPLLIGLAPSWWFIVAANVLLGVNQGLAWSMTVVMKIDLAGPRRRGLALGLNEAAGYLGVAATAFATGALAATYAPRTVVWVGAALIAAVGLRGRVSSFVRDTGAHVALEQRAHARRRPRRSQVFAAAFRTATLEHPVLRACSQAGLVNNLNDALAWGLAPLYLAAHGASVREIAIVAAAYPVVWGARPARHRLALRPHRPQAADRRRHARPGGALGVLVAGGGAFATRARRRGPARRRHGDGLPDADRRRLGREPSRATAPASSASTASGATSASPSAR